jgi:hypothetical protein
LPAGDWATWFSGVITFGLFMWTLRAWGIERRTVHELEQRQADEEVRREAGRVSVWVQRATDALLVQAAIPSSHLSEGTWCLCVRNNAGYALYDWSINVIIGAINSTFALSDREYGPIAPQDGLLVVPLRNLEQVMVPHAVLTLIFTDENGRKWKRGPSGLTLEGVGQT